MMNNYDTFNHVYRYQFDSFFTGIVAIYLIVLAVLFIFYVINYIFKGIGMYTIGKRLGMDYPWLAFIPFARTYFHGELAGRIGLKSKSIKNPGIWLLALPFIIAAVTFVFYLLFFLVGFASVFSAGYNSYLSNFEPTISSGAILGMIIVGGIWLLVMIAYKAVYSVLSVLIDHQIFARFTAKNMSVAHAVLGLIIPLYESFCLFAMRNKDFTPGMEPKNGTPFLKPVPPDMPTGNSAVENTYHMTAKPEGQGAPFTQEGPAVPPVPPVPPVPQDGPAVPPVPPVPPVPQEGPAVPPVPPVPPQDGPAVQGETMATPTTPPVAETAEQAAPAPSVIIPPAPEAGTGSEEKKPLE